MVATIECDRLFPVENQVHIAQHLAKNIDGTNAVVIESDFGHDGFLIEDAAVGPHLRRLLAS